jgi:hydrogenase nickel incorporation protein HypA/HybF
MHEFSIATGIVESVLEFAEAHPGASILKVRVIIGELTCVEREQLCFCYSSITKSTALDGSELEIEPMAAKVRCSHCAYAGPPKYWEGALAGMAIATLQCPRCGNAAEATCGHECEIKSVQVQQAAQTAAG